MFNEIGQALAHLATPVYWVAVVAAVVVAGVTGMVPGASGIIIMALSIPFIVQVFEGEQRAIGLVMLATMTGVNNTLDSIPAVLLGQPGAATQVTFLEGHQLARQGKAAHTLGAIYAVSALGGLVGAIVLAALVPVIKPFILEFTAAEVAAVAFFGIAMVSALSAGAMIKGLASGMLGVLFGTVGQAFFGDPRFIFQQLDLQNGLPIIAVTLGFFALPEMLDLAIARRPVSPPDAVINNREVWRGARDGLRRWPVMIRQSVFGVFLGAIPGVGAAVIDWLSYAFGIFWSRDKSQFGKGSLDGVLFAESAQNSKEAGQAVPTLSLAVPGGLAWAIVLVAMIQLDLQPGPQLLSSDADVVILLVITLAIANFMITMLGMVATGQLAKLTRVPYPLVGGIIIPITLLSGVLSMTSSWLALPLMAVFMGIGIIMKIFQWPRPPLILGIILGRIIETKFLDGVSLFGALGVVTRPITIALFAIGIAAAVFFARSARLQQPSSGQSGSMATSSAGASGTAPRVTLVEALLHVRNLPILLLVGGGLAFFVTSLGFQVWEAWLVPRVMASAVIALALGQLYFHVRNRGVSNAQIMDIGMHSLTLPGARQAMILICAGFLLFVMVTGTVGLRWGTIALAGYLPFTLLGRSSMSLVSSVVGGVLAGVFTAIAVSIGGGYSAAQVAVAGISVGIAVSTGLGVDARGVGGVPASAGGVAVVAIAFAVSMVIVLTWAQWPPYNLALALPLFLLLFVRPVRQYQPSHRASWLFIWRVLTPAITMSFVVLFIYVMADNILFIIWPEPALIDWFGEKVLGLD